MAEAKKEEEELSEETSSGSGEESEEAEEDDEETEEDEESDEETEDDEDDEAAAKAAAKREAEDDARERAEKEEMKRQLEGAEGAVAGAAAGGAEYLSELQNNPHDAEYDVNEAENLVTPPQSTKRDGGGAGAAPLAEVKNDAHDAAIDLGGDVEAVTTPRAHQTRGLGEEDLKDQEHDAAFNILPGADDVHVTTPPQSTKIGDVGGGGGGAGDGRAIKNDAHDVAFNVDDGTSVSSDEEQAKKAAVLKAHEAHTAAAAAAVVGSVSSPAEASARAQDAAVCFGVSLSLSFPPRLSLFSFFSSSSDPHAFPQEESSSEEDEAAGASPTKDEKGLYDPTEYDYLDVSKEVKDLFQFISVYKAHEVEVEPKLHPFIPDYIPAIGDIDGFIKVPRPDGNPSNLGLTVLDEPGSNQSNASVVALGLAYHAKKRVGEQSVARVEGASSRTKVIDKWVADMQKLHQNKHRAQVNYSKPMPDLETLLQVWPADFEDLLSREISLPPAKIDLDVIQYVRVVCALLDIPCYSNLVESVHVLLSLYSEFKANPHFQGGAFSNLPQGIMY